MLVNLKKSFKSCLLPNISNKILTDTFMCADFKNLTSAYILINNSRVLQANATIFIFL